VAISRRSLIAGATALAAAAGTAFAAEPARIRYAANVGDDLRPFLYAQEAGLFKQAGLDVTLVTNASGANVAQSVIGGAVEIGKASVTSIIAGYAHGVPFYVAAPGLLYHKEVQSAGICVAANSPLKTVLDLQGKTVSSTGIGSIASLGLRALVDNAGGDSTTIKWAELPGSSVPAALEAGRIDAGLVTEPAMSEAINAGKIRFFIDELAGYSRPILSVASFCTRGWAAQNKDAVARFGKVLTTANGYANTHVAETVPLLIPLTKMDLKEALEMRHALSATSLDAGALQPVIDLMVKYKEIATSFDARELLKPV